MNLYYLILNWFQKVKRRVTACNLNSNRHPEYYLLNCFEQRLSKNFFQLLVPVNDNKYQTKLLGNDKYRKKNL